MLVLVFEIQRVYSDKNDCTLSNDNNFNIDFNLILVLKKHIYF